MRALEDAQSIVEEILGGNNKKIPSLKKALEAIERVKNDLPREEAQQVGNSSQSTRSSTDVQGDLQAILDVLEAFGKPESIRLILSTIEPPEDTAEQQSIRYTQNQNNPAYARISLWIDTRAIRKAIMERAGKIANQLNVYDDDDEARLHAEEAAKLGVVLDEKAKKALSSIKEVKELIKKKLLAERRKAESSRDPLPQALDRLTSYKSGSKYSRPSTVSDKELWTPQEQIDQVRRDREIVQSGITRFRILDQPTNSLMLALDKFKREQETILDKLDLSNKDFQSLERATKDFEYECYFFAKIVLPEEKYLRSIGVPSFEKLLGLSKQGSKPSDDSTPSKTDETTLKASSDHSSVTLDSVASESSSSWIDPLVIHEGSMKILEDYRRLCRDLQAAGKELQLPSVLEKCEEEQQRDFRTIKKIIGNLEQDIEDLEQLYKRFPSEQSKILAKMAKSQGDVMVRKAVDNYDAFISFLPNENLKKDLSNIEKAQQRINDILGKYLSDTAHRDEKNTKNVWLLNRLFGSPADSSSKSPVQETGLVPVCERLQDLLNYLQSNYETFQKAVRSNEHVKAVFSKECQIIDEKVKKQLQLSYTVKYIIDNDDFFPKLLAFSAKTKQDEELALEVCAYLIKDNKELAHSLSPEQLKKLEEHRQGTTHNETLQQICEKQQRIVDSLELIGRNRDFFSSEEHKDLENITNQQKAALCDLQQASGRKNSLEDIGLKDLSSRQENINRKIDEIIGDNDFFTTLSISDQYKILEEAKGEQERKLANLREIHKCVKQVFSNPHIFKNLPAKDLQKDFKQVQRDRQEISKKFQQAIEVDSSISHNESLPEVIREKIAKLKNKNLKACLSDPEGLLATACDLLAKASSYGIGETSSKNKEPENSDKTIVVPSRDGKPLNLEPSQLSTMAQHRIQQITTAITEDKASSATFQDVQQYLDNPNETLPGLKQLIPQLEAIIEDRVKAEEKDLEKRLEERLQRIEREYNAVEQIAIEEFKKILLSQQQNWEEIYQQYQQDLTNDANNVGVPNYRPVANISNLNKREVVKTRGVLGWEWEKIYRQGDRGRLIHALLEAGNSQLSKSIKDEYVEQTSRFLWDGLKDEKVQQIISQHADWLDTREPQMKNILLGRYFHFSKLWEKPAALPITAKNEMYTNVLSASVEMQIVASVAYLRSIGAISRTRGVCIYVGELQNYSDLIGLQLYKIISSTGDSSPLCLLLNPETKMLRARKD